LVFRKVNKNQQVKQCSFIYGKYKNKE